MTTFESTTNINRPANEVYRFLADMNNHQRLMPENIIGWSSTADEARFNIENMGSLALKISDRTENSEVKIIPFERAPFELQLKWGLSSINNTTEVKFIISADLNMMMKMLASGPLQKLADHEVRALAEIFG
jgi:carbon monoxide dehydrogenase subunit G